MLQIRGRVFGVGQRKVRERRLLTRMNLRERLWTQEQLAREPRKGHIAPAGDDVIRPPADRLGFDLVTDLRSTQDHDDVRRGGLQQFDDAARLPDIPDVDA